MNVEAFLTIRLSAILTKNNGRKIEKLGHFYSRNKLHSLIFFFHHFKQMTSCHESYCVKQPYKWQHCLQGDGGG